MQAQQIRNVRIKVDSGLFSDAKKLLDEPQSMPVWVLAEAFFFFCSQVCISSLIYGLAFLYNCAAYPYNLLIRTIREAKVLAMIDKRIGKRMKQARERLGLTQEELAEKTGLTTNYISTLERGASFPRCEKLIILLNGLETSADAIFCDVVEHSMNYKASELSAELASLPVPAQKRILQMLELMIQQEKDNF